MNETKDNFFIEIIKFSLITLIIVAPFRMFVAKPFIVSGESMSPTFETGHYLIVDELSYRFNKPKRGDVIVMEYPQDPDRYFIKRIIGLPGEIVEVIGGDVFIKDPTSRESFLLDEDYVKNTKFENMTFVISDDEYFVMGDNRANSYDSRYWGALKKEYITGKAFVRLFPITQIDYLPGYFDYGLQEKQLDTI